MSSRSLRVSADLFEQALRRGEVMSRSAAQQLEHWARIGRAVEHSGLAVTELVALLQGGIAKGDRAAVPAASEPEARLWAHKRAQQRRDIASVAEGRSAPSDMAWFAGGSARRAKAKGGSPL